MSDDAARLLSGEAWRDFCRRLEAAGEALLDDPFPDDPRTRAEGFRSLTRLLVYATQLEIEAGDPLFRSFVRHQDPYNQWGGPNPDNVYLRANVDPRESYRVWTNDVRGVRQASCCSCPAASKPRSRGSTPSFSRSCGHAPGAPASESSRLRFGQDAAVAAARGHLTDPGRIERIVVCPQDR